MLILCNPDADALCAARILSYALRADKIPYQLRPCGGFTRLLKILEKLNLNDGGSSGGGSDDDPYGYNDNEEDQEDYATIRAVVLLNLGATRNLQKHLFQPTSSSMQSQDHQQNQNGDLDGEEENSNTMIPPLLNQHQTKLYVLDSHRPYHLANVHADRNIILWNDYNHWHDNDGGVPSDGDGLSEDSEDESDNESDSDSEDESSDDDDDDSDGEAEFDDDFGTSEKDKDLDEIDDVENDDEDSESVELGKRSSPPPAPRSPSSDRSKRRRNDPDTPSMEDSDHTNEDGEESQNRKQDDDTEDEDNDDDATVSNETSQEGVMTNRQVHEDRHDRIRRYYNSGTFHSSPVAFMAYTLLADQLRHETVGDLLWLACIGVTDAFIHNRLDLSGYVKLAMDLQEKIEKVYPDLSAEDRFRERMANTMYAEDLYGGAGSSTSDEYNGPMTQVTFSDNGRVLSQRDEFRFFLLRHTSLWDAMILSPDLNTKMELWRSSGIRNLQEMLAKMGLPLSQCQQPYAFMKPNLKRRLKFMMMEHEEVRRA